MFETIIKRILQPSTLRGVVMLLTLFGAHVAPDQTAAIATAGGSIVGAIEVFRNEDKKP